MRKKNAHSQAENRLAYVKWVLSSKEAHGKIFLSFIIRYIASQRKKTAGRWFQRKTGERPVTFYCAHCNICRYSPYSNHAFYL
jgi:hypothetical protein